MTKKIKSRIVLLLVSFCITVITAAGYAELIQVGVKAPSFTISDYNEALLDSKQFTGKKVVLLFGGRKESGDQADLKMALDKAFPDKKEVMIVSIGIVRAPGFIPRGLIKNGFKKETKGVQTFCDWSGQIAKLYGAPDSPITVIFINKDGIVSITKNSCTKADLAYLIGEINKK